MTHIFRPEPKDRAKWRTQANLAAAHLKRMAMDKPEIKIGFAFNDGVIDVTIQAEQIRTLAEQDLADLIHQLVLDVALAGMPAQGSA